MGRIIAGIALSTVAVYLWGFAYWGASTVPYSAWKETADDAAAGRALLEHFPESGVYYLPANGNQPELRSKLYERGPTGFVILDIEGRPEFDSAVMAEGFTLNGVVMCLLAGLLHLGRTATPRLADRIKVVAFVAAIAVVMVNFGDSIWWALPWNWELAQSFYNFTAILLGGSILARFMPDSQRQA